MKKTLNAQLRNMNLFSVNNKLMKVMKEGNEFRRTIQYFQTDLLG